MYDETLRIADYMPLNSLDARVAKLIDHHLHHLLKCVENELYSSSLVHLHLLYMIFVYLQILRIANLQKDNFQYSLIGFAKEEKDLLKEPDYPLLFSKVNEKTVFRFFRLCNMQDNDIQKLSKLVTQRNKHMHASDEIICETLEEFERTFSIYLSNMDMILENTADGIGETYSLLVNATDLLEPEYEITGDDMETTILKPGYFSKVELINYATKNKSDKLSLKLREEYT